MGTTDSVHIHGPVSLAGGFVIYLRRYNKQVAMQLIGYYRKSQQGMPVAMMVVQSLLKCL